MYGSIADSGMEPQLPQVRRDLDVGPRENVRSALSIRTQRISDQWVGVKLTHRAGNIAPGNRCFRHQIVGVANVWGDL